MDTTGYISTPDLTTKPNASYGELVEFWNKGNAKIEELQNELDNVCKSRSSIVDTKIYLERQIDSFMEALMQFVVDGEIEESVGDELAGYFNRDLTRKVTVYIRAEGEAEVTLPVGYDVDDIEGNLGVVLDIAGIDAIEVEYEDMSITSVEVQ